MKTSKRVLKDIPQNKALFKELNDYTKSYKDLEEENLNVKYEVVKLKQQNEKLQEENNKLQEFIRKLLEKLKEYFHKLLVKGNEKDKNNVVSEIKEYHKQELYDNADIHDIADNTSKEQEINDYLYSKNYDYDGKDFNI